MYVYIYICIHHYNTSWSTWPTWPTKLKCMYIHYIYTYVYIYVYTYVYIITHTPWSTWPTWPTKVKCMYICINIYVCACMHVICIHMYTLRGAAGLPLFFLYPYIIATLYICQLSDFQLTELQLSIIMQPHEMTTIQLFHSHKM